MDRFCILPGRRGPHPAVSEHWLYADVPAPQHGRSEVSRVGVGIRLSTLGAGAEVGVELGAVFQGSARTKLNLTGGACDTTGLSCVNAATDPTVQRNVVAEQTKINNKLSPFKYYPVISFGFGYRF